LCRKGNEARQIGADIMKLSRDFYIPKGAQKVAMKSGGAVFYLYEQNGAPCARCFIGKAAKPAWAYKYSSAEKRAEAIQRQIAAVQAREVEKAERKAKANAPHGWEVGLILVASWGYDQTNVDFYEVVEVLGKSMVRIEEIGSQAANDQSAGGSSMSNYVVPDVDSRSGKFQRCKVSFGRVKVSSCSSASPWDGKRKYCSWYA
jgi:hypothetical protein